MHATTLTHTTTSLSRRRGFTLVELLTVIAIIGILAGILIPTVGAAITSANKARTKAMFQQIETGLTSYKAEYGYYPPIFGGGSGDGKINLSDGSSSVDLILALSARHPATGAKDETYNRKGIPFMTFDQSFFDPEGSDTQIVDAFYNPEIFVMVDKDGDGRLTPGEGHSETNIKKNILVYTASRSALDNDSGYEEVTNWK